MTKLNNIEQTPPIDSLTDISLEDVFVNTTSYSSPSIYLDGLLYLTQIVEDASRTVLMYAQKNQSPICITPRSFDLRSKVNEYGGKPYWLDGDDIYFSNAKDNHIYKQTGINDTKPQRISPQLSEHLVSMVTDLVFVSPKHAMAIREVDNLNNELHNRTEIISISLDKSLRDEIQETDVQKNVLVSGADFYSNVVINKAKNKVAWVSWNHPNMPWDDTQLWIADICKTANGIAFENKTQLFADRPACYCQLTFANDGRLFFVADYSLQHQTNTDYDNFWNIYRIDNMASKSPEAIAVSKLRREFTAPHWQFGDHRLVPFDEQHILAIGMGLENANLYLVNTHDLSITTLSDESHTLQMMHSDAKGRACMIYSSPEHTPHVVHYSTQAGLNAALDASPDHSSSTQYSIGQHLSFPTSNGEQAYGFYYPANGGDMSTPSPLLVMVHGGPTARSYNPLDLLKQFWTSRGFAILDVNHRGSTGYGRAFRDSLLGEWGNKDALDIKAGVEYLIKQGLADSDKVFIRGKSAGGYAVLRALTEFPTLFRAGACYYGIGNLVTLAQCTHKFELHYTDQLIGESYSPETSSSNESKYFSRSPINYLERLQSPMIIFQGSNDKVVPPVISREVAQLLKEKNIHHKYVEYPGEGHGFRNSKNNIDAIGQELAFYTDILNYQ